MLALHHGDAQRQQEANAFLLRFAESKEAWLVSQELIHEPVLQYVQALLILVIESHPSLLALCHNPKILFSFSVISGRRSAHHGRADVFAKDSQRLVRNSIPGNKK